MGDSDTSEEGMENFLEHHRRAVSVQRDRESVARDSVARESIQRDVRASIARESVARQLNPLSEEPELKLSEDSDHTKSNRGDPLSSSSDDDNTDEESQA